MTSWQTPLCPFTIGFTADKLDEVRIAVVDAFYAVPRGGLEIGGVLYGKRMEGWLLITAYRRIETEYLTGPSFTLSEKDKSGLRELLADTGLADPQVLPVGWFVSHTRSKISLSAKDLAFYDEFFPEPWQVALVLRPEHLGPVRAGYFFRGENGNVEAAATQEEFVVEPFRGERFADEAVAVEAPSFPENGLPASPESEEPTPAIDAKKQPNRILLLVLLAIALILSGAAGYWVATH